MTYFDLFLSQITDPFRIGLLIALSFTMASTRAVSGTIIPALAGIVFVAALIPMTLHAGQPFLPAFLAGIVTNAVILGVVLALRGVAMRLMGR